MGYKEVYRSPSAWIISANASSVGRAAIRLRESLMLFGLYTVDLGVLFVEISDLLSSFYGILKCARDSQRYVRALEFCYICRY